MNLVAPVADLTCDIKKEVANTNSLLQSPAPFATGEDRSAGVHDRDLRMHRQQGHWCHHRASLQAEVRLDTGPSEDLEPFLPAVVDAASSIDKTHACVEKLAGCRLDWYSF